MNQYLTTQFYGELPIAYSDEYLTNDIIADETIDDTNGNTYEVRKTNNGKLVALLSND